MIDESLNNFFEAGLSPIGPELSKVGLRREAAMSEANCERGWDDG